MRYFLAFVSLSLIFSAVLASPVRKFSLEEIAKDSDMAFIGVVERLYGKGEKRIAVFKVISSLKGREVSVDFVYKGRMVSQLDASLCCELNGKYLVFAVKGVDGDWYYGSNGPYSTYKVD